MCLSYILFNKLSENGKKGSYYLVEDMCVTKRKDKDEYEGNVTYISYLKFRTNGQLRLNFPFLSYVPYSAEKIYEQAEAGDSFYLLCTHKHKVIYAFHKRFWELECAEFAESNGIFFPKENGG